MQHIDQKYNNHMSYEQMKIQHAYFDWEFFIDSNLHFTKNDTSHVLRTFPHNELKRWPTQKNTILQKHGARCSMQSRFLGGLENTSVFQIGRLDQKNMFFLIGSFDQIFFF